MSRHLFSDSPVRFFGMPSRHVRPIQNFSRRTCRHIAEWKWILWAVLVAWWWVPTVLVIWCSWSMIVYSAPVIAYSYNYILKWVEVKWNTKL